MNTMYLQKITDKAAIGLSLLCSIHCLVFPLLVVLLPSLAAMELDNEKFHLWMIVAVLPTSAYALTMGCKQHQHYRVVIAGVLGVTLLILALILGEAFASEALEKILTIMGAGIIVYGHYKNYRLCQRQGSCKCPSHQSELST